MSIVNVDNKPKPGGGGCLGVQYQHPNSFDKVADHRDNDDPRDNGDHRDNNDRDFDDSDDCK